LPRSSIVISDEPLSKETNYRTEFVAVLNNQPQGGFITRKPTVDLVASRDVQENDGNGFGFGFFNFQREQQPQPQPGNARRRVGQPDRPLLQQRGGWW
jgi:hypothetical protein